MSGYVIRQVVLDHLAGKGTLRTVVETDSAFDYAELADLGPTLRAHNLGQVADELAEILRHLPAEEIAWRRVFLVRDEDEGVILATKLAVSRPHEPRIIVRCLDSGEGVMVKGGDGVVAWWRQYLDGEMKDEQFISAQ